MAGTIGIYLVSFCFVINLWFQTAQAFERVTAMPNGPLTVYLMSLFLLSLVPKATEFIVKDVTQQMVLAYGVLTLVLMLVVEWLFLLLLGCRDDDDVEIASLERHSLIRRAVIDLSLRVVVIVISFFFPAVGVGIYLFVPLASLVSTIVDTNEGTFVKSLNADEYDASLAERGRVWKNPVARYGMFLSDAASVASDPSRALGDVRDRHREMQKIAKKANKASTH